MYARMISPEWLPFSMHERIVLVRLDGSKVCTDCEGPSLLEVLETNHCDNYNSAAYHDVVVVGQAYKAWYWCGKCD